MNTPARIEIRSEASRPAPSSARAPEPREALEEEPPVTARNGVTAGEGTREGADDDDDRYDNMPCTD